MLNRIRTTTKSNHKARQIRNKTKLYPPLMTGSSNSSSLSLSSFINNTDAILSEEHHCLLSQLQKSSESARIYHPLQRAVPNSTTSKLSQNGSKIQLSSNHSTRKQLVNSKTNNTDNRCYLERSSPNSSAYKMINFIYYFTAICLLALCTVLTAAPFVVADTNLATTLQRLKISPDIISDPYINTIKVELLGNVVKPGDSVPAKNFKDLNMAKISWDVNNFEAMHTLLLLDLDRRPGPNSTQNLYNQYTCINIPGNMIQNGQNIVAFETPSVPCQPSTKHRILMLAFHQAQTIDIADAASVAAPSGHSKRRENFKLDDFIARHRLELVAANVFSAIGDTGGVCSGSATIHKLQYLSSIMIAMVTAATAYSLYDRRSIVN